MTSQRSPFRCRSCGARTLWVKTEAGKKMLVDYDTTDESDRVAVTPRFDPKRHTSHFATCPNADQHRRR